MGKNVSNAGQLAKSAFQGAQQPIEGTTMAVTNFNRIVQDAPFGILGVSNNLEPMIQSFNKLKSQTGTTTGALKELLTKAFTGPGALITAVSAASSLLIVFGDRLFSSGKAANDLEEDLDSLTDSLDRVVELQKQFGAFDDDELGTLETQARIKRITEEIARQRESIRQVNELEQERATLLQKMSRGGLNRAELQRLEILRAQITDTEKAQERINKLTEERQGLIKRLVDTAEALTNEDVKQARQQQEQNKQKERQLELEKLIARARGSVEVADPQFDMLDPDTILPKVDLDLGERIFPEGSLGALKQRLATLRMDLEYATDPAVIAGLRGQIAETQKQMQEFGGASKESLNVAAGAADVLGNALAQAVVRGEQLGGVLKSLAAQLASRALINGLGLLLTGGSFSIGKLLFGGFRASGGPVSAGKGYIVGENGPEWFQPGTSGTVISNERLMGGGTDIRIRISGSLVGHGTQLVGVIEEVEYKQGR